MGCDGKALVVGLNPDDENSNTYTTMGYNTKDFETWTANQWNSFRWQLNVLAEVTTLSMTQNYDPYRQLFIFSTKRISAYADENIGMHYVSKNGIDFDF